MWKKNGTNSLIKQGDSKLGDWNINSNCIIGNIGAKLLENSKKCADLADVDWRGEGGNENFTDEFGGAWPIIGREPLI